MRKAVFAVLIIMTVLLPMVSCKGQVEIEVDNQTDYLVLLYLSGDADNCNNFLAQLHQAENALSEIRDENGFPKDGYATVNVLALWDGPQDLSDNETLPSDSQTRLFLNGPGKHTINEIGGLSGDDFSLSYQTVDLSKSFALLRKNRRQELNMGNPETLRAFLEYSRRYYAADNVILLIGDHGSGPAYDEKRIHMKPEESSKGVCFDDDTNLDEDYCMSTQGIIWALEESGYCGKYRPKVIIEDLCSQASIDEAYAFARTQSADYFMASENVIIGPSLGPEHLIKNLKTNVILEDVLKGKSNTTARSGIPMWVTN